MNDARLTLTDRAYDAQCALQTIKSYAYGGIATEDEARRSAAELRRQAEEIEASLEKANG